MWLCLLLSSAACELLRKLEEQGYQWDLLLQLREQMSKKLDLHPHPVALLRHAWKS